MPHSAAAAPLSNNAKELYRKMNVAVTLLLYIHNGFPMELTQIFVQMERAQLSMLQLIARQTIGAILQMMPLPDTARPIVKQVVTARLQMIQLMALFARLRHWVEITKTFAQLHALN
jgi:hypothetical protein